jgi:uridine kinase
MDAMKQTPLFVGIAGGTGSGKTTVAKKIAAHFPDICVIIAHDSYYRDQSSLNMDERKKTNYDHPDSLETTLLITHLQNLRKGKSISVPTYDFTHHNRAETTQHVSPKRLVIVEGILLFENSVLRNMMDIKLFVDTDADIRLGRRITRDMEERGRTLDFSLNQYLTMSRPMYLAFGEPTKKYADIILPHGGENILGIELVVSAIQQSIDK